MGARSAAGSTRNTARVAGASCKDCLALPVKPVAPAVGVEYRPVKPRRAPHPGPRCATHHRKLRADRSAARKAAYVEKTYSITEKQYQILLKAQNGRCYICLSKPWKRRLAVDHDHSCCAGPISCGRCVRGLLCKKCNRDVLGHLKDDPAAFDRGKEYLINPPARLLLGLWEEN